MKPTPNEHPVDPTELEHEAYGWVVRFISGDASPNDLHALKEWSARSPAHAAAFDHASQVWKNMDTPGQRQAIQTASLRAALLRSPVAPRRAIGRRAFLGGALAASAAGAAVLVTRPPLGLWPSWSELAADMRTEVGEQRRMTFANHVSVDLNTRTSIALRTSGKDIGAIELISGEAMVSAPVEGPGDVTLLAGDGRVVGSNARFNVRYDKSEVSVTSLTGNVRIEREASVLMLAAGCQVIYSTHGIGTPIAIDSQIITAWKEGVVIFDAMPVADVIAEVNRYRSGKIILTNAALGRERFNARFKIENMDRVLGQIAEVFGARVTSLPGGISLLG